jgi:hypothetical protein
MENSFIVLLHWWTGWLDMAFLWIPVGLISPHIHEGIHTGNPYLSGIHTGDGVMMAGYSVIAAWIREVWSG